MELQRESSNPGALRSAASRTLSLSSSAFVSANQSPFFSPRSPSPRAPDDVKSSSNGNGNGIVLKVGDLLSGATPVHREPPSDIRFLASDASPPASSICTSSNFGTPAVVYNNPSFVSSFINGPGEGSSSNNTQATSNGGRSARKEKKRRPGRIQGKLPSARLAAPAANRLRSYDVYIGFHGCKPSLLRFSKWLRAELEVHGISCFASDRSRCRNSRTRAAAERVMNASTYGVVILTKKSFGNPYSIEELRVFFGKKNLVPVFFDVGAADCLARDIVEKRGELWEKHGGELWMSYGGVEREWREAVDALSRAVDMQLDANDGHWRDCILQAVTLLATKLGRRAVVDEVNRWRERVEKEEFPFPRHDAFVGRKKELSELELILFGDVSGDGEQEYFELKARHRRRGLAGDDSKGKEPVVWKESEKEIEMQRLGRPVRAKRRPARILYGKGIACVSGESGIGKTELALEYAYRFSQRYKMVLWVGGESRYIRQRYLSLRGFLEADLAADGHRHDGGSWRCFEEQEEEAIARIRQELMRDVPYLVIVDNLESDKDWWDERPLMDLLPPLGGETHVIVTTRLPRVMSLEPMRLAYLSGVEAMALMRGVGKDYPPGEVDALKAIEEKLGRLTLGLAVVGAILSELPITPSRLLDTINRMPSRDFAWTEREALGLKSHDALTRLLDVCLAIFDHADGPRSLATRMAQAGGWLAPSAVPVDMLAVAAHEALRKHRRAPTWRKWWRALACSFTASRAKRSEAEAAAMLVRFGLARCSTRPGHVQFHELVRAYARRRGGARAAQGALQAVCLRGSVLHSVEHLWAACFLALGFGADPLLAEPCPSELAAFARRVAVPLAVHTSLAGARGAPALELLRLCTDALDRAADALLARAGKRRGAPCGCLGPPARRGARHARLWQEVALLKASVLETRAKLMLRGGRYDAGDDLIRKAIFIRAAICGERHPDTLAARETLGRLTRLLTNVHLN